MSRPEMRGSHPLALSDTFNEDYPMVEFHDAVLFTITSLIMILVVGFGIKHMQPVWVQFLLMGIAAVTLVVSSTNAAYLARAGQKDASYTEELPVVREAVALRFQPRTVVHDLGVMRTGQPLDHFALTALRRAVTAERRREDKVARHPREVQARRTIQALLAPKRG